MKFLKIAALAVLLSSCDKKNIFDEPQTFNDPNWIRIEIADGKEAHAVYGSIDDTLMVSTLDAIRQTTDKGKTWRLAKTNNQPIYSFLAKADTIFALKANFLKSQSNQAIASYSDYFSLNNGVTWLNADIFDVSKQRSQEYGIVHPNNQITLRIKENLEPINGNPAYNYVLKSDIEIIKNGTTKILDIPFNNQITNLHLDKKGRLYISATSSIHDKTSKKYADYEKAGSAIIYISKQNILNLIN
ncbi:hypothetical protein [Pedobacter sp. MW01-1-1]|uniref:hypothetical protein n=1 Tax=Pedobacter sp. MW01-1-1 TaxID=3383027 RepID=UPI003FED8D58